MQCNDKFKVISITCWVFTKYMCNVHGNNSEQKEEEGIELRRNVCTSHWKYGFYKPEIYTDFTIL
jgi:hypothetical protein